jgi:hypothetical protein
MRLEVWVLLASLALLALGSLHYYLTGVRGWTSWRGRDR